MTRLDACEALLGLALISGGLAMLSVPAACIGLGLGLLIFAVWPKRRTPGR